MDNSHSRTAEQPKYDLKKIIRATLPHLSFALIGAAVGQARLPFGAYPFGFALLAAADDRALSIYLGLCVSVLLNGQSALHITLGIYTALLLLRIFIGLTVTDSHKQNGKRVALSQLWSSLFTEALPYRWIAAALSGAGMSIYSFFSGGMLYYDMFGAIICTVLAPLMTLVFYRAFTQSGVWRDIGMLSILAAAVYGVADLQIYGVSVALAVALMLTFFVTERRGLGNGCMCGLVLGVVYSPILSPLFVLSALCVGIFVKISPTLSYFTAFVASTVWAFYIKGIYALDGIFGAILTACLLYSAIRRLLISDVRSKAPPLQRCKVLPESELDGVRLFEINRRMSAISEGLCGLSGFFEEIKLRYPRQSDLLKICTEAFESSCIGCSMEQTCRERHQIESEAGRLAFILKRNRGISPLDMDRELVGRCPRLPDILDEINYNSGLRTNAQRSDVNKDEVIAPDYRALSKLLEKSMENDSGEYISDTELSAHLCEPLSNEEFGIDGVLIYGKRRRTVYIKGSSEKKLLASKEKILGELEKTLPFFLDRDSTSIRRGSGGESILTVHEKQRFKISCITSQRIASSEKSFCGDSISTFENKDKRGYVLISDGMGSGREAAAVSEICVRFIERMLSVGQMNRELLCMLSGFLSGRCEGSLCECSTTVDLMESDLISGKTVFFKSGAAPTYVCKDGDLFKLRARTMPIGILPDSECKKYELSLSAGDTVIMVSDGVTGTEEECSWLFDLLRQNVEAVSPQRLCELIIKYAVGHGSEDDITVAVARIEAVV